jgi:hypothetical protein
MPDAEFEAILTRATEEGAKRALADVGLDSDERAGRLAQRLEISERTNDVQRQMLDAAARRPRDRDDLADRLRDGRF